MNIDVAIRRAQVYRFLSDVFLYPRDDWTLDLPALNDVLCDLGGGEGVPRRWELGLEGLQAEYRHALGLTGSLCYETEYGLPHEFRQSQELADIAGFYNAFGMLVGGAVRERPDHLATELEFMYVLALKEGHSLANGLAEQAEICVDAQRKFLRDHLGQWIGLVAERLAQTTSDGPYLALARLALAFVRADAERLGISLTTRRLVEVRPTPLGPELSCEACPASELLEGEAHACGPI